MKMHFSVGLVLTLLVSLAAIPLYAQSTQDGRTVQVSGEGNVMVDPDIATVRFGIVSEDENANEARRKNEAASREALDRIRELGVPENKIQMQVLRLQPKRERQPETREMREVGFEAIRIVSVELDDINMVPMVVAEVVQRGANRVEGVQYDREDRTDARNDALRAAAQDARSKAEVLASVLGSSVGEVIAIEERSYNFPRPMMRMEAAMAADQAEFEPGAYAAGELQVSAEVQIVFRLQ